MMVKLSDAQKIVLKFALDRGSVNSGRFGWSVSTLRALEKKGLVSLVSKATWDAKWKLTDLGVAVAQSL